MHYESKRALYPYYHLIKVSVYYFLNRTGFSDEPLDELFRPVHQYLKDEHIDWVQCKTITFIENLNQMEEAFLKHFNDYKMLSAKSLIEKVLVSSAEKVIAKYNKHFFNYKRGKEKRPKKPHFTKELKALSPYL